jgi:hypothetical protein
MGTAQLVFVVDQCGLEKLREKSLEIPGKKPGKYG